jgi:hypothetical protein
MKLSGTILSALLLAPSALLAASAPGYLAGDKLAVPDQRHMLDNVFVNPEAYASFQKTGAWPDQTIFVKENRIAESAGTLSKSGRFQSGVMTVEIHVKDQARFPGQWAFFASTDGKVPATLRPASATCYSCHGDHGAVDTTFVQFYPTLLGIAKAKGTLSAGYLKDSAVK